MGSRISIGLVYAGRAQETAAAELRRVLGYLARHNGLLTQVRASRDPEGQSWVEEHLQDNREMEPLYDLIVGGCYAEVLLDADLLGHTHLALTIRLVTDRDYFGFLLDFDEGVLLGGPGDWQQRLATATGQIVGLVRDLFRVTQFAYAFCDEEAEISDSPAVFRAAGYCRYSLAFLPVETGAPRTLSVVENSWAIDGLTPRA